MGRQASSSEPHGARSSRDELDEKHGGRESRRSGEHFEPGPEAAQASALRRASATKQMALGEACNLSDFICDAKGISPDASAREKMIKVMTLAKESGMTTLKIFKLFDLDGSGTIEPAEFKAALERLDSDVFRCSDEEVAALVAEFDADGDGHVDMAEFVRWCYELPSLAWKAEKLRYKRELEAQEKLFKSCGLSPKASAHDKMVKTLMLAKASDMENDAIFRCFDTDLSGSIDADEFAAALNKLNGDIKCTKKEVAELMAEFKRGADGNVDTPSFMAWCLEIDSPEWKKEKAKAKKAKKAAAATDGAAAEDAGAAAPQPSSPRLAPLENAPVAVVGAPPKVSPRPEPLPPIQAA